MLTPPHRFKPDALLVVSITLLVTVAPRAGVGSCNHILARGIDRFTFMLLGAIPIAIVWGLLMLVVADRGPV